MAHILYRGSSGRDGEHGLTGDEFGADDASGYSSGHGASGQGARAYGQDDTWHEYLGHEYLGQETDEDEFGNVFAEEPARQISRTQSRPQSRSVRLEEAEPAPQPYAAPAPKGRVQYAMSQHPAVHESLMQVVREENPAVQHFIDLQRAAAARAAEIKAREAKRREMEAARAEAAALERARAQEEAHLARYGFVPEAGQPLTSAQITQIQLKEAQEALAAAKAEAEGRAPRAGLAEYLPASSLSLWAGRGMKLASAALAVMIVAWSANQAARDAAGLTLIKAPAGPAREAPLDPGGELARHTGLAVNSVAATGAATQGDDRILLAPMAVDLAEEDAPMAALKPLPSLPAAAEPEDGGKLYRASVPVPDAPSLPAAAAFGQPEELTAGLRDENAEPLTEPLVEEDAPQDETVGAPNASIDPTLPGLKTSPRPLMRPRALQPSTAPAAASAEVLAALKADTATEIDPKTLKAGTRLAQLGAFDSPDLARAEWLRVAAKFEALMAGKRRVIQEAVSGGRTFYRLRVEGFEEVAQARQFCAALVAEHTNCTPAQVR